MTTGGTGFLLCNQGHPKFEPWFNPGPGRIFYGCHRWSFPKGWTGKLSQNWYQHSNIAEFINGNIFFLSMENSVSTWHRITFPSGGQANSDKVPFLVNKGGRIDHRQ